MKFHSAKKPCQSKEPESPTAERRKRPGNAIDDLTSAMNDPFCSLCSDTDLCYRYFGFFEQYVKIERLFIELDYSYAIVFELDDANMAIGGNRRTNTFYDINMPGASR